MRTVNPSQDYINMICRLYGDSYDDREEDSAPGGLDWRPGKTANHKSLAVFKRELEEQDIKLSSSKILKILITGGCWSTERTREVQRIYDDLTTSSSDGGEGLTRTDVVKRIAEELEISEAMVCMSLPYDRPVYDLEEKSSNAVRCGRWRGSKKAEALRELRREPTSYNLWRCICLNAGMKLRTSGRGSRPGIAFTYSISTPGSGAGQHYAGVCVEGFGNEMIIALPTGEKKKTISRSTVDLALKNALEAGGNVRGPKALNVPGAHSYLYPILVRFGII